MPLLGILGLLTKVPKLIKAIKGGDTSLADKVVSIAKAVTGEKTETHAAEALMANPELLAKYEIALLNDKHVPDQMDLENTSRSGDSALFRLSPMVASIVSGTILATGG